MKKVDYSSLTDEELLDGYREGAEIPVDCLMDKYKFLVRNKASSMFLLGADREDLIQEGMIGLYKAIRDYDSGRDASFYTFAELCISRQMYSAVQAAGRKKHIPLNTYISLYEQPDEENNMFLYSYSSDQEQNPEKLLIDKEDVQRLERRIEEELSSFEKQVLDLSITGMGYGEIARILGREEKSTDNALQRIRAKVRKIIQEKET